MGFDIVIFSSDSFLPSSVFIWICVFTFNISEFVMFLFHLFYRKLQILRSAACFPSHIIQFSHASSLLSIFKPWLMVCIFSVSKTVYLDSLCFFYDHLTPLLSFKPPSSKFTTSVVSLLETWDNLCTYLLLFLCKHFGSKYLLNTFSDSFKRYFSILNQDIQNNINHDKDSFVFCVF